MEANDDDFNNVRKAESRDFTSHEKRVDSIKEEDRCTAALEEETGREEATRQQDMHRNNTSG